MMGPDPGRSIDRPAGASFASEVSTGSVIEREVASQDAAKVPFAEDEHMIQAFPPNRPDEPLGESILHHALYATPKLLAVDAVTIT